MVLDARRMGEELTDLIRFVKAGGLGKVGKFAEASDWVREIKDIAFSGDGEPTMIPNFAECVQVVADIKRAEALTATKIVLITDAAGLNKADVRRGLEIMDANQGEIWGKLDAGTESYYRLVNRSSIKFERILKNLTETARVRPIIIQSLFLKVHGERMPEPELLAYCDRLREIRQGGGQIKEVHAYTIARPTPAAYATRLEAAELNVLAEIIRQRTGLPVCTFE
jgi:wyosine [tRNA(Phe)-imidazoG37] synthetase (radical SAM superfamily)